MGTLYIVPTPIGNLEDITIRAIRILFTVDGIACEDTRKTGLLLRELRIRYAEYVPDVKTENHQRLLSYYEQNEKERLPQLLNALKNGLNVALVSDAGTPGVSDPGFRIVKECVELGVPVISLPGPTSVTLALTLSGLPTDKFWFLGYPPLKQGKRLTFFKDILSSSKYMSSTFIFFEAPHKLLHTLSDMKDVLEDLDIVICREMTKKFEEVRREKISESLTHFTKTPPKGEFVILFHL